MKLTRRELAMVLGPAAALAQTPAAPSAAANSDLEAARARMKANGDALARQAVPMDTEPAFQFKA